MSTIYLVLIILNHDLRSADIVQEIAQCSTQYDTNQCATNPIPAMAQQCGIWRTCMDRDPSKVGRAKVGAELIAEVVNGFVEPISWKTLVKGIFFLALERPVDPSESRYSLSRRFPF